MAETICMKPGLCVLALLIMALVVLPLAPAGTPGTAGTADQSTARGMGHMYRFGTASPSGENGMQGPGPMPHAARHGSERPESAPVQQELRRDPFEWNTTVRRILLRSYRRLFPKNILDYEKRERIYATILTNPGIDATALSSLTGINLHTLRYHLSHLLHMQKIACAERGGSNHFFENHGRYDHAAQQQILYERYPTTKSIMGIVKENPGVSRGEIADRLALAGPSVTRWMQRMVSEGLVVEIRDGRYVRYYPARVNPDAPAA